MSAIFGDLRRWMFEEALPFWSTDGIDRAGGGYVEHFTLQGAPYTQTKRVFVVCRQIYVFAHASLLGFSEGAECAAHGIDFLDKAWISPREGFPRRVDTSGAPVDPTPDLYALSFALFALAWGHRISGGTKLLKRAHETLDFIETHMRHPSGAGFWHELPGDGPRQQNPHMHLIEGLLALAEFSGEQRFLDAASQIARLFATRFYNARTQTLAEFFAGDFSPLETEQGRLTEPGHQQEWAWILGNYQRLSGTDMREIILGLHESAERHGVDPVTHATYNIVREDGLALDKGSRIWPNTERIKGAIAVYELTGRSPVRVIEQSGRLLLDRYLAPAPKSRWIDNFDASWTPAVDKIPASSLYHLVLAFAEALRVAPD